MQINSLPKGPSLPTTAERERMLENISAWGASCQDIMGLALVGSSARLDHPADEWSDIDLVVITHHPDQYLETSEWSNVIGKPWISTFETDPAGKIVEQRILFCNGIDVDFIVISHEKETAFQDEPLASIMKRGMRILIDKIGVFPAFAYSADDTQDYSGPTPGEFTALVNDFWFHAVWTAKKIKRGELWTAKSCCDVYMKHLLLKMIEWYTHAFGVTEQNTWYNGRFIEQWAPEIVLKSLPDIFAHYDEKDIWKALRKTMQLFDTIASETARRMQYAYPEAQSQSITKLIGQ